MSEQSIPVVPEQAIPEQSESQIGVTNPPEEPLRLVPSATEIPEEIEDAPEAKLNTGPLEDIPSDTATDSAEMQIDDSQLGERLESLVRSVEQITEKAESLASSRSDQLSNGRN